MKLGIYHIDFYYFLFIIFIKIAIFIFKIIIYQNMAMVVKDNNSKRRCYDMRLYLVEWVVLNPEAGREMKYIYNMSKSQLIQACLYTEGKLTKQELIDLINYVRGFLKASKARLKEQKEQETCSEEPE
jgi:hypothetical protein